MFVGRRSLVGALPGELEFGGEAGCGVPKIHYLSSFLLGTNRSRGRRFSVAGEYLNPTSDMSAAPSYISLRITTSSRRNLTSNIVRKVLELVLIKILEEDKIGEDSANSAFGFLTIACGDNFYIVDSGELYDLYRDVVVATIGSGKNFGEIALMYNCPLVLPQSVQRQIVSCG
jgi:hypothetical protein